MNKILVVEDDSRDLELTVYALQNTGFCDEIKVARDGAEAIDYLSREGAYKNRPPGNPAAILLDIHLPKIDGVQVLKKIRSNPDTRDVPVLMLSAIKDDKKINASVSLGIHGYLNKPVDIERLSKALQRIGLSEKQTDEKSQTLPKISYLWESKPEMTKALKRVIETGVNKATGTLRAMTGLDLELDSINISILKAAELADALKKNITSDDGKIRVVSFDFTGAISGTATLILSYEDTAFIVKAFSKEHQEDDNFAEMYAADIFSEIGNILINRIVGSIGRVMNEHFDFSAPLYFGTSKTGVTLKKESGNPLMLVLVAQVRFKVKNRSIESNITLSLKKDYFNLLLNALERQDFGN